MPMLYGFKIEIEIFLRTHPTETNVTYIDKTLQNMKISWFSVVESEFGIMS